MAKCWGKADDTKPANSFNTPRNGINAKDLSVEAVKAVHKKHFLHTDHQNFAPLHCAKAQTFEVGETSEGHSHRELSLLLRCVHMFSHIFVLIGLSGSQKAKAAAREANKEDDNNNSKDNKDCKEDSEEDIELVANEEEEAKDCSSNDKAEEEMPPK